MEAVNMNPALTQETCRRIRAIDRQLLDYAELDQVLADLMHRPKHEIMVPISDVAFIPGELRDTNCILTLLGDQTFVEKTNIGARQLIARRQIRLEQERGQLIPLLEDQIVDIREEYIEEDEKEPQMETRPRPPIIPAVSQTDKSLIEPEETFDEFWNRLGHDQLEVEEQKQQKSDTQLHGFFANKPKPAEKSTKQQAANPVTTQESNPAPKTISRFKAQRQQMKS